MNRLRVVSGILAAMLGTAALSTAAAQPGRATEPVTVQMLSQERAPPPKVMVYRKIGDRELKLYVYAPTGHSAGQAKPALITIHGGGWSTSALHLFTPPCRYFAGRGMVAINIEYRLTNPTNSPIQNCIDDCRAALRFTRAHAAELGIDTNRIAVMGDSAGGHLAACLGLLPDNATHPEASSMPNAMILCNPVVDLESLGWTHSVPGVQDLLDAAHPEPDRRLERARSVSPIAFVRPHLPPILLMHGTADNCVPIEQIDRFAEALKRTGNRCQYERLEGWKHAFVLMNYAPDETSVKATQIIDRFLVSLGYLEGEPTLALKR